MEKIRIHYIFHGTVQGVGFRYKACYSAKNRGVTGWVRILRRSYGSWTSIPGEISSG